MKPLTIRRHIDAPADAVWAVLTDIEHAEQTLTQVTAIEMLSEGPFAVGTRWRETRVMGKHQATEEMWVSAIDPGRAYTVEADSCGARYESTFVVTPAAGNACDVSLAMQATPQTLAARVMGAVMGPIMKKMVVKCLEQDLADVAALAEAV